MGAFNNIVITGYCPFCEVDKEIECQTHVASSFDGDETGRFCQRSYKLGEPMAWWKNENKMFNSWRNGNYLKGNELPKNIDFESCYSTCVSCKGKLYVIVMFIDLIPRVVIDIGIEEHWPIQFSK